MASLCAIYDPLSLWHVRNSGHFQLKFSVFGQVSRFYLAIQADLPQAVETGLHLLGNVTNDSTVQLAPTTNFLDIIKESAVENELCDF